MKETHEQHKTKIDINELITGTTIITLKTLGNLGVLLVGVCNTFSSPRAT